MAEKFTIKAEVREGRGTNHARRLRREGKIPVVVYGGDEDAVAATAELKDLAAIIRSDSGANTLFTLDIDGNESRVIFQDRHIDPVTGRMLHADLRRLAKGEKIELTIPVNLIGDPKGVVEEGGVLQQQMREMNVKCTPSNIPESIDINVEHLDVNESITISDVTVDDEVEILEDPETLVASVTIIRELDLEAPTEEEEAAEPELVGEGEETEGEETEGEASESDEG